MKGPPRNGEELHIALKEEIQLRVDAVANGSPRSFEDYRNLVGVVTGLRIAEQMLKALLDRENNDDIDGYSPP
jgi:hypothetical protein